jgi:hypothetical protein
MMLNPPLQVLKNNYYWQRTLADSKKAPEVAYQDDLNEFDSTWGVKGLIMTWNNLVVTSRVRPHVDIISLFLDFPSVCVGSAEVVVL